MSNQLNWGKVKVASAMRRGEPHSPKQKWAYQDVYRKPKKIKGKRVKVRVLTHAEVTARLLDR